MCGFAALVAASPFNCPSTTMIIVIEGYSTLDSNVVFKEAFHSVVTALVPAHRLDSATPVFTQSMKASTLLISHALQSNTTLITDAPNLKTAVFSDYMTIPITNPYNVDLSLLLGSNVRSPSAVGNPLATPLPETSLT